MGSPILSDFGHASSYTLSIKGLVFENGPNGALSLGAAGGISGLDLDNDSFYDNKASLGGAVGMFTFEASPATVTIENSTFRGNQAALEGGAVYIEDSRASTGTPPPIVLSGNTFTGNAVNGAGTSHGIGGGALFVGQGGGAFAIAGGDADREQVLGQLGDGRDRRCVGWGRIRPRRAAELDR